MQNFFLNSWTDPMKKIAITMAMAAVVVILFLIFKKTSEEPGPEAENPVVIPAGARCQVCDGEIPARTAVISRYKNEPAWLCTVHCYFVFYTSLTTAGDVDDKTKVVDWSSGKPIQLAAAIYIHGKDEKNRRTLKAFSDRDDASRETKEHGGNFAGWNVIQERELATRCELCARAVYPEDACSVQSGEQRRFACSPLCAFALIPATPGEAEMEFKDALTGDPVRIKLSNGVISSMQPGTWVAWTRDLPTDRATFPLDGRFGLACFLNENDLKQWTAKHALVTGRQIGLPEALDMIKKVDSKQIGASRRL
jgi:hypothetical protein